MTRYYSNGKLLITGEYVVLDGATALALPTKFGQSLEVRQRNDQSILWKSKDEKGNIWFEEEFMVIGQNIISRSANPSGIEERLISILTVAHQMNPAVLSDGPGYELTSMLGFNKSWGLGSSSTLINNIAQWFEVDAYWLLKKTFGGSGYDIAAAQHDQPILYKLEEGRPTVLTASFDPVFQEELFFVHLNQKQDSRQSIQYYQDQPKALLQETIRKVSGLSHQLLICTELEEFELLLEIHETLISQLIGFPKIKSSHFSDYPRKIKSLGGWGGDFILATGEEKERQYFRKKGYETILEFPEMIRGSSPENP